MNKRSDKKNSSAVTLVELIVSIVIVSIMVLTVYGIYTYSHSQVLNAERRAKVQNELAFALEHMSKYVQQANGDTLNPPIKAYPDAVTPTGFQVRVDFNSTQTPSDLTDDAWVSYSLASATHTLSTACTPEAAGTCGSFVNETLSDKIIANFESGTMPNSPTNGFYVSIDPSGNIVEVGLVGRFKPAEAVTTETRLLNPQVELKAKMLSNSASAPLP